MAGGPGLRQSRVGAGRSQGMVLVIRPLSFSSRATREVKQRFDCWEHIKLPAR